MGWGAIRDDAGGSPSLSPPCGGGSKWRRFGAVLYAESGCALARLELQEGPEKTRRGDAGRRVIRLSDCLRVAEAGSEASSPRDTSAFLLETKERLYLLAAPTAERSDWLQAICLLAFPVSRSEGVGVGGGGGPGHFW
uniref:PH domain-containing protein n=1 Tax=Oryctolagus cuniculus TaxID=9986 RepID=G1TP56_RABIT